MGGGGRGRGGCEQRIEVFVKIQKKKIFFGGGGQGGGSGGQWEGSGWGGGQGGCERRIEVFVFFKITPYNLLIVLYHLLKVPSL